MENNYFTPENSWKHLFFITGLTADKFYTDGGLKLNIEQFTFLELKKRGYESNGIKLSGQMPKTSLILKSERSFYFSH